MGIFDDIVASDAANIFGSADMMPGTESVVLANATGGTVTVTIQVFRNPPAEIDDSRGNASGDIEVFLPVNSLGVFAFNPTNLDAYTMSLPRYHGGTAKSHQIVEVKSSDPGGWMLRLRG